MKIGIVGGYGHECLKPYPGAKLAWAGDGYDEKARDRAQAFGGAPYYASMEEMIAEFAPDVIYVGTVFARNGLLASQALERGFDVVGEKPLAVDRETLDRLRSLTADGRRGLIAEFAMRWSAPVVKMRELFQAGAVGAPVMIHAQKTYKFGASRPDFYRDKALFGGIIPWVAVHAIDYAFWCSGLRYESVSAVQGNRSRPDYPGMEDHAAMLFTMEGGVPCTLTADFLNPSGASSHADDRLRITGTEGVLEMRRNMVSLIDARGEQQWECNNTDEINAVRATELVRAARRESESHISTADSLHVTEAAVAARLAAETGHSQRITA